MGKPGRVGPAECAQSGGPILRCSPRLSGCSFVASGGQHKSTQIAWDNTRDLKRAGLFQRAGHVSDWRVRYSLPKLAGQAWPAPTGGSSMACPVWRVRHGLPRLAGLVWPALTGRLGYVTGLPNWALHARTTGLGPPNRTWRFGQASR